MSAREPVVPPLGLVARLLSRSQEPALLVDPAGRICALSEPARRLLAPVVGFDPEQRAIREVFGLGWRELATMARDGSSDLVLDVPARSTATPGASERPVLRGLRVRTEAVPGDDQHPAGVVAYLDGGRGRSPGQTDPFHTLFGHDVRFRAALALARRFAPTRLPVLLLAETGTGKDRLARAIHRASERATGPFVAINCGGLSPQLLESELFGYGPGAFTGAKREGQEGKVAAAAGGTLFLDEVAEMPPPLQAVLLRFLEDGTYYRIGENRLRHADVRLLCATCRNLARRVADGRFRDDLFYRISGTRLHLPPVRERSDVAELARHLLEELARDQGRATAPTLSPETLVHLARARWPGNVRELKHALHHALVLADGRIEPEHLPKALDTTGLPLADPAPAPPRQGEAEPITLHEAERRALEAALAASGDNLSETARLLGVARSTLYRLLERHGHQRPER